MVREVEEEMVVLSSMMGGVDGGVFVLAVELGEVLHLELETVSNRVCLTYILKRKV